MVWTMRPNILFFKMREMQCLAYNAAILLNYICFMLSCVKSHQKKKREETPLLSHNINACYIWVCVEMFTLWVWKYKIVCAFRVYFHVNMRLRWAYKLTCKTNYSQEMLLDTLVCVPRTNGPFMLHMQVKYWLTPISIVYSRGICL